ncbi:MAG: c-type cytochrome biogenesis protein CcsB [Azoarcus sp.]|jgi:cytochrome c-type biogenesis protein CcsB|nr:c-type cytochrome biogenesis protein CcsB [Azoarcus sp.]
MEQATPSPTFLSMPTHTNCLAKRNIGDWLFALAVIAGTGFAYHRLVHVMDGTDIAILILHALLLIAVGWLWRPFRLFSVTVAALALFSIWLYQGDLTRSIDKETLNGVVKGVFFLKYLLSSQSAISWMSAFIFMATGAYWIGLAARSSFAERTGSALTWWSAVMGTVGLCVRWHESWLLSPETAHIPISSLYEVMVFFCLVTALLYLFYENRYNTRKLGAFILPIISIAAVYMLWLAFNTTAYQIQPLTAPLRSYWMKIHVPANFIGYGGFTIAAMVGVAYLLVFGAETPSPQENRPPLGLRASLAGHLPEPRVLEDIMYKAIAIGFAFFTVATILGALWAAEAWGGYWSWDPKEVAALIVWLNYAVWLHMRLTRNLRGTTLAWWAFVGLFVSVFAFIGVNTFLGGLHSYGNVSGS